MAAAKTLVAAAAMALVIYAYQYLVVQLYPDPGLFKELLNVLVPMIGGTVVFFFVVHVLRMEEMDAVKEMLSRQLGRVMPRRKREP
jgi:hypothetical protein